MVICVEGFGVLYWIFVKIDSFVYLFNLFVGWVIWLNLNFEVILFVEFFWVIENI